MFHSTQRTTSYVHDLPRVGDLIKVALPHNVKETDGHVTVGVLCPPPPASLNSGRR